MKLTSPRLFLVVPVVTLLGCGAPSLGLELLESLPGVEWITRGPGDAYPSGVAEGPEGLEWTAGSPLILDLATGAPVRTRPTDPRLWHVLGVDGPASIFAGQSGGMAAVTWVEGDQVVAELPVRGFPHAAEVMGGDVYLRTHHDHVEATLERARREGEVWSSELALAGPMELSAGVGFSAVAVVSEQRVVAGGGSTGPFLSGGEVHDVAGATRWLMGLDRATGATGWVAPLGTDLRLESVWPMGDGFEALVCLHPTGILEWGGARLTGDPEGGYCTLARVRGDADGTPREARVLGVIDGFPEVVRDGEGYVVLSHPRRNCEPVRVLRLGAGGEVLAALELGPRRCETHRGAMQVAQVLMASDGAVLLSGLIQPEEVGLESWARKETTRIPFLMKVRLP